MAKEVYFEEQGDIIRLVSPYNANFVDAMKAEVPPAARNWDGECWSFDSDYAETVEDLAIQHYNVDYVEVY